MYDITNRESFEQLDTWIDNLLSRAEPEIVVMLIGNKLDKVRQDPSLREVDFDEGENLAQKNDFIFMETSAFASENVSSAFETLLSKICQIRQSQIHSL